LDLVCKGFHNPEIAKYVGISPRMVKECVGQLLLIYEVSNRIELAGRCGQSNGASSED
jgi:DNA-binding NarL/FixJ family response regulator